MNLIQNPLTPGLFFIIVGTKLLKKTQLHSLYLQFITNTHQYYFSFTSLLSVVHLLIFLVLEKIKHNTPVSELVKTINNSAQNVYISTL